MLYDQFNPGADHDHDLHNAMSISSNYTWKLLLCKIINNIAFRCITRITIAGAQVTSPSRPRLY